MTEELNAFLESYHNGSAIRAYEFLGCHPETRDDVPGYVFRVWAPNAQNVYVVGDFNFWNPNDLPMVKISRGVWEAWSPNPKEGCAYKYLIRHWNGRTVYKADPVGFRTCRAPDTSSVICCSDDFKWKDSLWFARNARRSPLNAPVNIYEMHLGSWRRKPDGTLYSYSELAPILAEYVKNMGYTHVELMPLAEYPYDPSWGYQVTHYYAPTSRYGSPRELMELVDTLHQAGIGVILDWVPAHFPKDEYGLYEFDGTCTYELGDPSMNEHPDWTTRIFDFGKPEVKSFLISNAVYWLEKFHIDGLRVDAVSSMLYLDYNRSNYKPNRYGGRENLEAIEFIRQLNKACFSVRKNIIMAAEESTAFPLVTKPDFDGGLGFLFKWNMGWMNDTLKYIKEDPIYRKYQHNKLTFSMTYAFSENYILPLSHDEVVHMKGSLINKQPGDYFWKFAGLRTLRGYQMAHPGKKLCFMGGEIGQFTEWNFQKELDWMLLDYETHEKLLTYNRDLNHFYLQHSELWANDLDWEGYQWIQPDDGDNSILAFRRIDRKGKELIAVLNFTPVLRENYRLGVSKAGTYVPVFCSDDLKYGGTGQLSAETTTEEIGFREYKDSALFRIPPMSLTFFQRKSGTGKPKKKVETAE
ncbi:MAG: 1,4-alpha-glucan branching protein GlgB [Oscillospiraceae bacterium]|nr:1,4-alpha-glucan branching protein GlgB [Oscillospiraceae bacterium]